MNHDFSQVVGNTPQKSQFKRPYTFKGPIDFGKIYPFYADEVLPGDVFNVSGSAVARLSTPIFPIQDGMYLDFHFFFVPNRLVWTNWTKFQGERDDPADSIDFTVPRVLAGASGFGEESLFDYLGLPNDVASLPVNALIPRCYQLIWNEYYRAQNVVDSLVVSKGDGPDTVTDYELLYRTKRADYFTRMNPAPQKGDAISVALGTTAPVIGDGNAVNFVKDTNNYNYGLHFNAGGNLDVGHDFTGEALPSNLASGGAVPTGGDALGLSQQSAYSGMIADLTDASAITVDALREAVMLQQILELDMRAGSRYPEIIQAHWGIDVGDATMQRPELIGIATTAINVKPIPQTSETGTSAQGNLAAIGYAEAANVGYTYGFKEHGHVLGLVSARCDLTYQQGKRRMWDRQTRFDFYEPMTAHLGEQTVLSKELYCDGTSNDDDVLGYVPIWEDYRYIPSMVVGKYRSNSATSLDSLHLAQDFATRPTLNAAFLQENPPIDRVVAVPSEPDLKLDVFLNIMASRPMPVFGTPGFTAHL